VTAAIAPNPDDAERLTELVGQFHRLMAENRIGYFKPYPWQTDFHAAGAEYPERMLMAANRTGKTMSAAVECTYHLTGNYPDDWQGKRFPFPIIMWTGSPTTETSRDIVQHELLGGLGQELGTGWIPKSKIIGNPTIRQAGVRNVIDAFKVRHATGGVSVCFLKAYEQGWQKFQGGAPHVVWLDEEPNDYMVYSEAQTRIISSRGIILVTFTPLLGVTELVEHFQAGAARATSGIYLKGATWDDAPHLAEADRKRMRESYRAHEVDARTQGIPMLGEGAVFPVSDAEIRVDPFKIPDHFARIKGCDFGIDHPAAGVDLAWDRDQDVVYIVDTYRKAQELAPYHAAWFNKANKAIPVAWPHDGMNREKAGGRTLAEAYRLHGVNMLSKSARYPRAKGEKTDKGGPQPVEPIVDEVLERMVTGRFKVFANLSIFFEEKRSYHRKDGKIVDRRDDVLKATFYALMMKRYAVAPESFAYRHSTAPAHPIASARL